MRDKATFGSFKPRSSSSKAEILARRSESDNVNSCKVSSVKSGNVSDVFGMGKIVFIVSNSVFCLFLKNNAL